MVYNNGWRFGDLVQERGRHIGSTLQHRTAARAVKCGLIDNFRVSFCPKVGAGLFLLESGFEVDNGTIMSSSIGLLANMSENLKNEAFIYRHI